LRVEILLGGTGPGGEKASEWHQKTGLPLGSKRRKLPGTESILRGIGSRVRGRFAVLREVAREEGEFLT